MHVHTMNEHTMNPRTMISTGALLAVVALTLSGCAGSETASDSEIESLAVDVADRAQLAEEREKFMEYQQQPLGEDYSTLTAKTPEQIEMLEKNREFVESRGSTTNPEGEGLMLAATINACETSIMQNHDVTQSVFETHMATSPLFAQFADNPAMLDGLAGMVVFGTEYICPDDYPQWDAAYEAVLATGWPN